MIQADIAAARKNLPAFIERNGGTWRGLTLETLRDGGCGFIGDWTSPDSRLAGTYQTPTPRLIIPTPNHYLARLTVPIENFSETQRKFIRPKQHIGNKETFNIIAALEAISKNPDAFITAVEGEIDAMSIWQATNAKFPTIAISGADNYKMALKCLAAPEVYGYNIKKIRLLIVLDPDDAGRKAAPKFRQACIEAGIPAVVRFLTDEVCKIDFNDALCGENGADRINDFFNSISEGLTAEFETAEKEIADLQAQKSAELNFASVHNLERAPVGKTSAATDDTRQRDPRDYFETPPEYEADLLQAMLDAINVADLTRTQWLAVMTALKNLGVDYAVADEFNRRDPDRYNEKNNLSTWNSVKEPYGIEVIVAYARADGFDFKSFYYRWYQEHPEYSKPHSRNRTFAQDTHNGTGTFQPDDSPYHIPQDDNFWQKIFYKPFTNLGDAKRIAAAFGEHIRYATDTDSWYIYRDGVWNFAGSKDSALYPYARAMADYIAVRAAKLDKAVTELSEKEIAEHNAGTKIEKSDSEQKQSEQLREDSIAAKKLAGRWQEHKNQSAAIKLMKGDPRILITSDKFDQKPFLLNVANGTINLRTGKLQSHNPTDLLAKKSDVVYDSNKRSTEFDDFMVDILPDEMTRRAVLRFCGYCLTGVSIEERALFIHGDGGNGKSTLCLILKMVLGNLATTLNIHTFLQHRIEKDPDAPTPEISKLIGVRLALADEIPPDKRLDAANFNRLTGNDPIPFRRLHCEASINTKPTHKIIFDGNNLPRLDDPHSDALNRRLLIAEFPRKFTEENCDTTLKVRLLKLENLTGALTVMVEECLAWQRDLAASKAKHDAGEKVKVTGLLEPDAMKQAKQAYFDENDWFKVFVEDNCTLGVDGEISRKDFIDHLKCDCPQARLLGTQTLTKMIESLSGVEYQRTRSGYKFFGIDWTDNLQQKTFDDRA